MAEVEAFLAEPCPAVRSHWAGKKRKAQSVQGREPLAGPQADEALDSLQALIADKFGEGE